MHTDPISDMLTRIRNAIIAGHKEALIPFSNFKHALANLLLQEGFLSSVKVIEGKFKGLHLTFRFDKGGQSTIKGIERVSSPGQRIYYSSHALPRVNGGFGVNVVSTSKGLMSDRQARKEKYGGEVVCKVW